MNGGRIQSPRGAGVKAAYFNDRAWRILAAVDAVAARCQATPAQVALAWQMARPTVTAPIASATTVAQFRELVGAATLTLSADDIAELSAVSA